MLFTEDGISGGEFMICTWGNVSFRAILISTVYVITSMAG